MFSPIVSWSFQRRCALLWERVTNGECTVPGNGSEMINKLAYPEVCVEQRVRSWWYCCVSTLCDRVCNVKESVHFCRGVCCCCTLCFLCNSQCNQTVRLLYPGRFRCSTRFAWPVLYLNHSSVFMKHPLFLSVCVSVSLSLCIALCLCLSPALSDWVLKTNCLSIYPALSISISLPLSVSISLSLSLSIVLGKLGRNTKRRSIFMYFLDHRPHFLVKSVCIPLSSKSGQRYTNVVVHKLYRVRNT